MADAGELKAVISAETSDFISKMNELVGAVQDVGEKTSAGFENTNQALTHLTEHAGEAEGAMEGFKSTFEMAAEFAGFNVGLEQAVELLKELASEAVEAYSKIELMTAGMTALTGSAEDTEIALGKIEEISKGTIFSFPELAQAAQKMAALGISADDIPRVLTAAADAAELLGTPLEGVAQALDNVYTKGQLTLRSLLQLGLTWQDLAKAIGDTSTSAKQVLADFNSIQDPMDKVNILTDAMNQKFGDAAEQMKDTLSVQVNALKTEWHELLVEFGREVAPDLKSVIADLQTVIPLLESIVMNVTKWAIADFDKFLKAMGDIKAIVIDLQGLLPNISGYLGTIATAIEKITGIKIDAGSALKWLADHTLWGPLADLPPALSAARQAADDASGSLSTLGQNAMQTGENTKKFQESLKETKPHVTEFTGEVQKLSVASVDALKQLGLLGQAPDPFKTLDENAQKAFDTFLRGFQGIDEEWNTAAAGVDPEKLLGQLKLLEAELIQNGQQGSLAFIQIEDAIKGVGDYLVNNLSPDHTRVQQDIRNETDKTIAKYGELTTKIQTEAAKAPLDPLVNAMKQLGIESTSSKNKISADLTAIDTLLQNKSIPNLEDLDQAWVTLTQDAHKYANDPAILPKIIQAEKDIVDGLTNQGAPLGEIYSKNAEILTQEINLATTRGENASAYIIALDDTHTKQQLLIDQAQLAGQTYVNLMGDFKGAFDTLGKGIADNIVDAKDWGDMFMGILKGLSKQILEDLIGTAFKALEDTILKHTTLLQTMADKLSGIFKTGSGIPSIGIGGGGVQGAPLPGAGGAIPGYDPGLGMGGGGGGGMGGFGGAAMSGAMGWASLGLSAVSAVSSVISNFQMARQENSLNAIELNTRLVAMFIGGLNDGGVQTWTNLTAQYTSKLLDLDGWIHDAWVELLGGKDTLLGYIGPGGWIHDYMANGQGPNLDMMANNSTLLLDRVERLLDVTVQGIQQMTVTINALGITTREAASQLADQIGKTLAAQMAGSSLR